MKMSTFIIIFSILVTISIAVWTFVKSSNWISSDGSIEEIELVEKYNDPSFSMADNKKSFEYIINVKYNYTVNTNKYTGTKLYPGLPNIFNDKKDAENVIKKYPAGTKITVYYDPSTPQNASLETSKSIPIKSIVILVVFVIFVSLIVIGGIIIFPKLLS